CWVERTIQMVNYCLISLALTTLKLLEAKGQKVALNEAMGSTQSIMVGSDGELYGASDSRLVDDLTAGY
ncbi:hypothetical protein, partial [Escherichia coli]|uniref:hypothetical protein n=1 Tax=Escherichia coli TaxID=562 RepID=UPI001FCE4D6E